MEGRRHLQRRLASEPPRAHTPSILTFVHDPSFPPSPLHIVQGTTLRASPSRVPDSASHARS